MVGQDPRVGAINKLYCRDAVGAIVVCDISDKKTMDATLEWKEQLDQVVQLKSGLPLPMILAVNKSDLVADIEEEKLEEHMKIDYINQFAQENDFVAAMRVSAKTGENVAILFSKLVREILLKEFRFDSELEPHRQQ